MGFGLFGKLPQKRDFLSVSLPPAVLHPFETWLQQAVAASRSEIGRGWEDYYLVAPIWRFWLGPEIFGTACAGALMPSVDQVGRYFPLAIIYVAENGEALPPPLTAPLDGWFRGLEERLLSVLSQDDRAEIGNLLAGLPPPYPDPPPPPAPPARLPRAEAPPGREAPANRAEGSEPLWEGPASSVDTTPPGPAASVPAAPVMSPAPAVPPVAEPPLRTAVPEASAGGAAPAAIAATMAAVPAVAEPLAVLGDPRAEPPTLGSASAPAESPADDPAATPAEGGVADGAPAAPAHDLADISWDLPDEAIPAPEPVVPAIAVAPAAAPAASAAPAVPADLDGFSWDLPEDAAVPAGAADEAGGGAGSESPPDSAAVAAASADAVAEGPPPMQASAAEPAAIADEPPVAAEPVVPAIAPEPPPVEAAASLADLDDGAPAAPDAAAPALSDEPFDMPVAVEAPPVMAAPVPPAPPVRVHASEFKGGLFVAVESEGSIAPALAELRELDTRYASAGRSYWWCAASARGAALLHAVRGLPDPYFFSRMLMWRPGGTGR